MNRNNSIHSFYFHHSIHERYSYFVFKITPDRSSNSSRPTYCQNFRIRSICRANEAVVIIIIEWVAVACISNKNDLIFAMYRLQQYEIMPINFKNSPATVAKCGNVFFFWNLDEWRHIILCFCILFAFYWRVEK